jgi:sugar/nucleoside kinase (ribokinase family)
MTLGDRGAMALDGAVRTCGVPVNALDTTGAGDVFRAGFIHALLRGAAADEMLRFANAAAAVSCTRLGALGGIPDLAEVNAMMSAGQVRV